MSRIRTRFSQPRLPKYRLHRPSGRAVIQFKPLYGPNPKYLDGPYDSTESRAHYQACCSEILAYKLKTRPAKTREDEEPKNKNIVVVIGEHLPWAEVHYGLRGRKEFAHLKHTCKVLKALYGRHPINKFGPRKLKAVREAMVEKGWSRKYVNDQVHRIRRIIAWAVENEFCDADIHANLKRVVGLKKGKTTAPESRKIRPVEWSVVAKVLPYLAPMVRAMVEIQWLTGMRSDELTGLRTCEINMDREIWVYEPEQHKTADQGKVKVICFGPRCQELLRPYLPTDPKKFIFAPSVAAKEKGLSNQHRSMKPRYDAHSYRQTIDYGLEQLAFSMMPEPEFPDIPGRRGPKPRRRRREKGLSLAAWLKSAGVEYWHPHQLRHSRGTITRENYGIEGAQAQLGNTLEATQIYAEKSFALAERIARETG